MTTETEFPTAEPTNDKESGAEVSKPTEERKRMPPLQSRFLFVDVASRRAKQLRRGALPRLESLKADPQTGERPPLANKLERIAMKEVDEGLIVYELPDPKPPNPNVS
jgi:DNA-directed RNA polymerase subunit K/omega